MLTPYKDREISAVSRVQVYRNLHRKMYSVRQNGKVVAHGHSFCLLDPCYVVNSSGREKCRSTGERNVHAYVTGYLASSPEPEGVSTCTLRLTYNPYTCNDFVAVEDTKSLLAKDISGNQVVAFPETGGPFIHLLEE